MELLEEFYIQSKEATDLLGKYREIADIYNRSINAMSYDCTNDRSLSTNHYFIESNTIKSTNIE